MAYIPNDLREARKRTGLRQRDVADKLGMKSTDRISRWEMGLTYPHLKNALLLAKLYNRTVEQLYPTFE